MTHATHATDEQGRLRRLVDQLPVMVGYWDTDLRNVTANAAYAEWFGRSAEEMRGMPSREVLGPVVHAQNLPYLRAALAGEAQVFERTLTDASGQVRHTEVSYVPDVVDDAVVGMFVAVTDLTARIEAQRDLDDAQEIAGVGSWSFRPATGEVVWSRQMFRLTGQDPTTFTPTQESYLALVHPADRDHAVRVQRDHLASGSEYDVRYRLLVGGEVRHVHSRARQVQEGPDGPVLRGTMQDETELQRKTAELMAANDLLSDMMGMLGHDVRQPAAVVLGYLDETLDGWEQSADDVRRQHVRKAFKAAQRMNALIDDILVMVNVDSGTLAVRPSRVDLGTAVREVLAQEMLPSSVELAVHSSAPVDVDPFHLRQVLVNLVANAARYGESPITVGVAASDGEVALTVADRGEGVPPEFVPHLFERFARAGTGIALRTAGSGFGLYIVRALVTANGGTIAYAPNVPSGALFTVTLPVVRD